ncbi:uncharacterized protein LOC110391489 [Numida meleagris]|uniref:uncharacterized protein LOC110391489 n=1 Tax=Numida meleagris TaxID=8996 RepID=UPI000B3E0750|nr:uncharacterized protein LOC110391489 [Numida meleagris]
MAGDRGTGRVKGTAQVVSAVCAATAWSIRGSAAVPVWCGWTHARRHAEVARLRRGRFAQLTRQSLLWLFLQATVRMRPTASKRHPFLRGAEVRACSRGLDRRLSDVLPPLPIQAAPRLFPRALLRPSPPWDHGPLLLQAAPARAAAPDWLGVARDRQPRALAPRTRASGAVFAAATRGRGFGTAGARGRCGHLSRPAAALCAVLHPFRALFRLCPRSQPRECTGSARGCPRAPRGIRLAHCRGGLTGVAVHSQPCPGPQPFKRALGRGGSRAARGLVARGAVVERPGQRSVPGAARSGSGIALSGVLPTFLGAAERAFPPVPSRATEPLRVAVPQGSGHPRRALQGDSSSSYNGAGSERENASGQICRAAESRGAASVMTCGNKLHSWGRL